MGNGSWGLDAQIVAASELTERMCQMPATPVADWSQQAAEAFSLLVDECPIVVGLCTRSEDGQSCEMEDVGVALECGRCGKTSRESLALADGGLQHWRLGSVDSEQRELLTVPVRELDDETAAAWMRLGAEEVAFVSVAMDEKHPRRRLVAGFGLSKAAVNGCGPARKRVLSAVVPRLLARARCAFGTSAALTKSDRLTKKESEVLGHLMVGRSIRKIAELMERSPHTVHDHAKSLHTKLHASSRGELVARALGHCTIKKLPNGEYVCYNISNGERCGS